MNPHQYRRMRIQRAKESDAIAAFLAAGPQPHDKALGRLVEPLVGEMSPAALVDLVRLQAPAAKEYRCLARGKMVTYVITKPGSGAASERKPLASTPPAEKRATRLESAVHFNNPYERKPLPR